jgi:hypothetical protein
MPPGGVIPQRTLPIAWRVQYRTQNRAGQENCRGQRPLSQAVQERALNV